MKYLQRAKELGFRVRLCACESKVYEVKRHGRVVALCIPEQLPYVLIEEMEKAGVKSVSGVIG